MANTTPLHGIQEIHAAQKIRLIVQLRFLVGFRNESFPRKMQYTFDGILIEDGVQIMRIAKIAFTRGSRLNKGSVSSGKIVEDHRMQPCAFECFYSVASDIPCA